MTDGAYARTNEDVRCMCGRLLFKARNVSPDAGEIETRCPRCGQYVTWSLGRTLVEAKQPAR